MPDETCPASPHHQEDGPSALPDGLVLVSTPIGNLGDLTPRARETLLAAHLILCEDTRHTARLLAGIGARARLQPLHEHNEDAAIPSVLARLRQGERIALVSDAGVPLVSDPGYRLVRAAVAAGHAVTALPGPSAVPMALALSGLPTERFLFSGFLPAKAGERRRMIGEAAQIPATLVFFEAPHRLAASLADLAELLGDRPAAVARELTKLFEEVRRDSLSELAAHYARAEVKGEIVLVIGPPGEAAAPAADALDAALREALATASVKDAAAEIAARFGLHRREVYARALSLKRQGVS